ncbi:MAG: phosphoribosylamine---glycine ligase, partial [Blastocatellia bacterium]|nr:phosphoribosylamine---glycine ligase [Blastocatellia bacterium]
MRILVIGSGGREHALLWALRRNARQPLELFCAPGNAGIAEISECPPIGFSDIPGLLSFSEQALIDLVIVGPEAPLAAGVVDEFQKRGLKIVGPGREAARLESSKAFAKDFMRRHSIPTARYRTARAAADARAILHSGEFGAEGTPVVIKADGLAAGKGVIVAQSRTDALRAIDELTDGTISAEATELIIIEEALTGREVSLLLFSDGRDYRLMPPSRDHKRVGEHDTGPNTGGMGSITASHILDDAMLQRIVREVVEPTLRGARDEGFPFRGVLFVGLMLTSDGPLVLEYNVRFGDPETQAILMRLNSDLADIFQAISETRLGEIQIDWSQDPSACVVLAARGYPAKPETGSLISGLAGDRQQEDVAVF